MSPSKQQSDLAWRVLTQVQDYARVSFFLIGPDPVALLLPHEGEDLHFPNASDAIVIRCSSQDTMLWR